LEITLKFPNAKKIQPITIFVAHLKSKLGIDLDKQERETNSIKVHQEAIGSALSTIRRSAEAAALRVELNKVMRKTKKAVAVLGDLNDSQLSVTTSIITGRAGYRVIAKSRKGAKSDAGLYSAGTLQEYRSLRDMYFTHIHENRRESLDHILVSEQFYDHSRNRIWSFNKMRIWNDYLEDEDPSTSDHGAVRAIFDYNPFK
jgi:predicted extracellular nuclease